MKKLDINTWNRKSHFDFFKDFHDPFFNITANVDVTKLYHFTKKNNLSFFLTSLFLSTKAINEIENFRYRIRGNEVIIHDKIDPGSTYLYDDNTFGFIYFNYVDDLFLFHENGKKEIKRWKNIKDMKGRDGTDDEIHYSIIPWTSFTSFKNASNYKKDDSIPIVVFGKYFKENGKVLMPVSVEVHHSLMDGYHVGKYFDLFHELSKNINIYKK